MNRKKKASRRSPAVAHVDDLLDEGRRLRLRCNRTLSRRWVSCDKTDPGASEDLNRLATEAVWDRENRRRVRHKQPAAD